MPLTTKQQRFVEEYCVDFNATKAAIRAEYSEKTAGVIGCENLKKPNVKAAIKDRLDALTMTAEEALMRLSDMARASAEDITKVQYDEVLDRYIVKLDPGRAIASGKGHLISGVKMTDSGIEVKLHDAKDALDKILKAHGVYGAKGTEDDPIYIAGVDVRIHDARDKAPD